MVTLHPLLYDALFFAFELLCVLLLAVWGHVMIFAIIGLIDLLLWLTNRI